MNESQSLEVKIKSTAEDAVNGLNKLLNKLNLTGNEIKKISTKIDSNGSLINRTITTVNKNGKEVYTTLYRIGKDGSLDNTTVNMRKLGNETNKTSKMVSNLSSAISLTALYYGVRKITTTFLTWMSEATDRTEQLNLFNVVFENIEKNGVKTFSKLGKEAIQFQNKLNNAFGTNLTDTLKYQALFQSMGENASIPKEYASIMSETMTKFTYDLASLYNKTESDVAEALRAGVYAGQTKPLRSYGIDVTQSTMQPLLESLGINDRTVKDLSQGEKEILRYLASLKQAKVAMGDFANTIESPSNQLKVFKNQLTEAKVALSSLFIGSFSKILPYANALLMVIKEVTKAIGMMFGIKLEDYNSGIADSSEAFTNLEDSIDGATDSVKQLKRQTLGFDQINNINENKDSGSGTSINGGIDQRLLDAIYGYDNGMDKVRMKATEIRDKIMEWLGFTKQIDPLTSEISWKLDGSNSTMGKLITSLKKVVKYGKEAVSGVFKVIKKDFDNGSFGKTIIKVFETLANLLKSIAKSKTSQTILAKLLETFIEFKIVSSILEKLTSFVKKLTTGIKGLNGITGSLTVAITGIATLRNSIVGIEKEGINFENAFMAIGGTIATVGGSIATGTALLGPIGGILGGIAGGLVAISTVTQEIFDESLNGRISNVNDSLQNYEETMSSLDESKQKYLDKSLTEIAYYEDLYNELKLITDENGNIQDGYETRANFIVSTLSEALGLEISIIDGQVQKYTELETKIYDVIEAKRAQYLVEANTEKYNTAMDERISLEEKYQQAVKNTKEAWEQANPVFEELQKEFKLSDEELQNFIDNGILSLKHVSLMTNGMRDIKDSAIKYRETLQEAIETENKAGEVWAKNQKIIGDYENALGFLEEKNYSAVSKIYEDTINYQGKTITETEANYDLAIEVQEKYLKNLEDNKFKYDEEYLKSEKNRTEEKIRQLQEEKRRTAEEIENQNKLVKQKTLQGINEQLETLNDKKYEFKETSDGMMQLFVDGIAEGKSISETTMTNLVNGTIQKIKDKKMSAKEAGEYLLDGVNLGLSNKNKQNNSFTTAGTFASKLLEKFKSVLGIKSPSRETKQMGIYLLEGLGLGLDEEKRNTLKKVSNLSSEILDEMDMDLGKYVFDFNNQLSSPNIEGNINHKTSFDVGSLMADKISMQIANAINNRPIQIDLEAHTDEGVVIDRINQSTRQTGVCPINIPF